MWIIPMVKFHGFHSFHGSSWFCSWFHGFMVSPKLHGFHRFMDLFMVLHGFHFMVVFTAGYSTRRNIGSSRSNANAYTLPHTCPSMYTFIACCKATLLYIWLRNNCTAAITKMGTFWIAAVQVIIPDRKNWFTHQNSTVLVCAHDMKHEHTVSACYSSTLLEKPSAIKLAVAVQIYLC